MTIFYFLPFRRQKEMDQLKKKLSDLLNSSINKLFDFISDVNQVPLSVDVNVTLQSLVPEDICPSDMSSLESLKVCLVSQFNKQQNQHN